MFEDKTLVCKDCGKEFVWTAGEQEFYASRGFENQPQRCKPCRDARKNGVRGGNNGGKAEGAFCARTSPSPSVTPLLVGEALALRKLHLFAASPTERSYRAKTLKFTRILENKPSNRV